MKNYRFSFQRLIIMILITGLMISAAASGYAESLSGYTANGTATTSSTSFATVTSVNVSTAVTLNDPILVVVTFMTESQGTLTIQKDPEFNLTDTAGTAQNTIYRSLQGVNGGDNDRGIGSIVNIFNASSTTPTYYFEHRVSTAGNQIQTKATIVAIPLRSVENSKILANAVARVTSAVTAPATPTVVTGTTISLDTNTPGYSASPGAYYVAASVETYSTSISGTGNTGEWQIQYCTDGTGTTWYNLGYPVQRTIRTANQYGVANLVGLLPNITPTLNYQFRLVHHKVSGATDIFTDDVNIVAVFTGINVLGTPHQFPTYETQSYTVTTTSNTLVEAIGLDIVPQVASTRLFMHAQYWMSATGKDIAYYDLDIVPDPPFTSQQLDRYLPSGSKGSGASVGLASNLTTPTSYRVSLRHAHDATGQTLTTQNPWLIMMDLNTPPPSPDLAVTKICSDLIPGQDDALIYTITISNIGTDVSPASTLTDTIPAGVGGSLTNIRYIFDVGIPPAAGTPWPVTNFISLPSIAPGDSLAVRIYADVPYTLTSIPDNTATVTLAVDTNSANNSATCSTSLTTAPTASRALNFNPNDGTDDYVSVGYDSTLDLTSTGTLEAWIYMLGTVDNACIIHKDDGSSNGAYSLRFGALAENNQVQLIINDGLGNVDTLTGDTELNLRQWYHVAGTWNATTMSIFIDGIFDKSLSTTPVADTSAAGDLFIGALDSTGANSFYGIIDEARVWNMERGITDIRNYMCRKYVPSSSPDPNLVSYLRFDEDFGPICGDTSGNGNIGIITDAVRICSEAPIGDDSTHDYDETGGFTVTDSNTIGDSFTATEDSGAGTWSDADKSGLQIYRVDNPPEPASGSLGSKLYSSRGHWGVFVTGGVDPTYSVTYTYSENGIGDENGLSLMFRHYNCEPWKNIGATLNIGANTLTYPGLSGTEFILGANVDPRNAIDFDGTNDFVDVTDDATHTNLRLTNAGTLEAWIKKTTNIANAGIIAKENATDGYSLETDATGTLISFRLTDSVALTTNTVTSSNLNPLSTGIWYHIAATWDAANMNLYINGVLDPNSTAITRTSGNTATTNLTIGVNTNFFDGMIDEVRVWNAARLQTRIQDTMCKKITSSESDFSSLMGYWRFDEETNSTSCPDYSSYSNIGIMNGFSDNGGTNYIEDARDCSSAPIGDDSDHDYNAGSSDITLTHSDGDSFRAAATAGGTWTSGSGIHVYRVDEAPVYPPDLWVDPLPPPPQYYTYQTPNGLTPPAGPPAWSSIDYYRYWGVFVTDWVNDPSYDATYNYNGNPMVPVDDTSLGLARRDEYCDRSWTDSGATLNSGADTLTLTDSLSGAPRQNPEYVLGGISDPLAIVLAAFTARVKDGCVEIYWATATEIDTLGFQLWRSTKKDGPYAPVSGGFISSKSQMETMGASYDFKDCEVETGGKTEYYYKLEEIDMDSGKDNAFYGPIGPVREGLTASQTTPKTRSGDDGACFISILKD